MSLRSWVQAGFITLLLVATTVIIYATGGTSLVYVHLIYVPILVGGFFFGLAGGIVAGLVAGLFVGPWLPVDVAEGLPDRESVVEGKSVEVRGDLGGRRVI